MSVYKDKERGTWFVSVPYRNYLGERKQKVKRGFETQRQAKAWERLFIDKMSGEPAMLFNNFLDVYLEFCKKEVRANTYDGKQYRIKKYILPYFCNMRLNEITSLDIKRWQQEINEKRTDKGELLKDTYKQTIDRDLIAIFNHAKKYYNLSKSPHENIGKLGSKRAETKQFLTLEQFKEFIEYVADEQTKLIFIMLFYTGLRIGELLALTFGDIDTEEKTLTVNKSISKTKRIYNITKPKTLASNRTIALSNNIIKEFKAYKSKTYGADEKTQIFTLNYEAVKNRLRNILEEQEELPKITLHSFRHSHTALLVELGYNPLVIAERLGHTDIKITMNTYAHLYPNKQKELAKELDKL